MRARVEIAVILAVILTGGQALAREGRKIFGEVCQACHQAGGKGAAGVAPPLVSEPLKRLAARAPDYVPLVVLNGLSGPLEVAGTPYHLVMPPQAGLSDGEIAAVSTYVYATLNGQRTLRFTERQIATLRATPQKASDLRALRKGAS